MKNHLSTIFLIIALVAISLAACQPAESEDGPAEAYWGYFEACEKGKVDTAESFLNEEAKTQVPAIGACGMTHDAINRIEGQAERTYSEDPQLEVSGENAVMTWFDDQGNVAIVNLVKTGDGWKVAYTVWST